MAIFGFKKRKDEKLESGAQKAKSAPQKIKAVKEKKADKKSAAAVEAVSSSSVKAVKIATPKGGFSGGSEAIIRPRITEKSGILSQSGRYTFEVMKGASKASIAEAVNALYKVKPVKVTVLNTPAKNVFVKGRKGVVSGSRKAIVTLKQGDKIDFV